MLELNKIYCMDVLEGLKQLDDESIDLIITSPPYNKVGLNGIQKGKKWNKTIDYNDDPNNDNMNEQDYQDWQTEILKECDDEDLDEWERHYITLYDTIYPNGYNDNEGGSIGFHHSERTKQAIAKTKIGKDPWNKGKTYEETYDEETAKTREELKNK